MTANKEDSGKNKRTILVAGGAGFVGALLCKTLLSQDNLVFCFDNLSTGSKENIRDLLTNPDFHFVEADITQPLDFLESVRDLDVIFHLAATPEVGETEKLSLETLLVNSMGTRNLLEAAKRFKAKFVLASAADIYQGTFSSSSFKYFFGTGNEEMTMSQHEAKRFAEALTVEYYKNYKLSASIARLKDVYGPGMRSDSGNDLVGLIAATKKEENLSLPGDGLAILNPTYVSDVVFGLIKISEGDFSGEIFNLVNNEKTTLAAVAETLRLISGKIDIIHDNSVSQIDFPPPPPLDLEKTTERLKWHPRVSLAEGLSSTLESFREFHRAKMVNLTSGEEKESQVSPTPKRARFGSRRAHLRLGIFLGSLAIIFVTSILPFLLFILATHAASSELQKASDSLRDESIDAAKTHADSASKQAQRADQDLNSIRWLFQLSGQHESLRANEQLLAAAENTASGLKLLSQVVGTITAATSQIELAQTQVSLQIASQYLDQSSQNFDLAQANLDQIKQNKLVVTLSGDYGQINSLVSESGSSLKTISDSLSQTLEKIQGDASTAP